MCKVGGPRCSDTWGRARRDLDLARRASREAAKSGDNAAIEAADRRSRIATIRLRHETEARSSKLVSRASEVFNVDDEPDLNTVEKFFSTSFSKVRIAGITREEYVAIGSYTGDKFMKLNAVRRGVKDVQLTEGDVVECAQIDSEMKNAMARMGSEPPCVLYRGVPDKSDKSQDRKIQDFFHRLPVGADVIDQGWMSTTSDFWVAEHAGGAYDKTYCMFRVFGGKSLPVSSISAHAEEEEFIVEPGTKYTVIGHHVIDNHYGKKYAIVDIVSESFSEEYLHDS